MACMEFEMGKVSHSSVLVDVKVKERGMGAVVVEHPPSVPGWGAEVVELP